VSPLRRRPVTFDTEKIDEAVMAVVYLTAFMDRGTTRAWKTVAWDVMDRLYLKGFIEESKAHARSVRLTPAGVARAEAAAARLFA
jgi:hypothetical protein